MNYEFCEKYFCHHYWYWHPCHVFRPFTLFLYQTCQSFSIEKHLISKSQTAFSWKVKRTSISNWQRAGLILAAIIWSDFHRCPSSSPLLPIIHSGSRVTDSSIVSRCFHTIFTSCQLSHRFHFPRKNICIFDVGRCVDNDDDRRNKLTASIIIGNFPFSSPPFTEYLL